MRATLLLSSTLLLACPDDPAPPAPDAPDSPSGDPVVTPPVAVKPAGKKSSPPPAAGDAGPAKEPPAPDLGATTMSFSEVKEKATAAIRARDYKAAEAMWSKYILEAPSDKQAVFELGRIYYLMGDLEGAKKQAEVACFLGNEDGCVQKKLIADELARKKK